MRFRTWPVAALGLASLLVLVVFSVRPRRVAPRKSTRSSTSSTRTTRKSRPSCGSCDPTTTSPASSFATTCSIPCASATPNTASGCPRTERPTARRCSELRRLARARGEDESRILRLEANLEDYWEGLEPLFDWTIVEKINFSASFLGARSCRGATRCWPSRRKSSRSTTPISPPSAPRSPSGRRALRSELCDAAVANSRARAAPRHPGHLPPAHPRAPLRSNRRNARRKPNSSCASCRSSWWRRRRKSAASCRASCTITSARC